MATQFKTVKDYIDSFPDETKEILQNLREIILKEIPQAAEGISYNMPTFYLTGDYIIYFAAWKKHISLYPFSAEMTEEFPETSQYITSGKGTIQFPLDKPLPIPLIRKIIKYRLDRVSKKD